MRVALLIAFICLGCASAGLQAAVYSCVGADGKKTFSDQPCPVGSRMTAPPAGAGRGDVAASAPIANAPRYGLSFGLQRDDGSGQASASCDAGPPPIDRPRAGRSCDPYRGDTACSRRQPLLCWLPVPRRARGPTTVDAATGNVTPPAAAAVSHLGAGPSVQGDSLTSEEQGSAVCERVLGAGWRMARFHDSPGGWSLQAQRHASLAGAGGRQRYWVSITDQPGNCWNATEARPAAVPVQKPQPALITVDEVAALLRQMRDSSDYTKGSTACRQSFDRIEGDLVQSVRNGTFNEPAMLPLFEWLQQCSAQPPQQR